jgi:hypothetical protein
MYIACTHEHRKIRRHTPVFLPHPTRSQRKKINAKLSLGRENLFWNASTAKNCVDGIEGDWKETWHRDIHPPSPTLRFFDNLSLYLCIYSLSLFSNTRPSVNTNDGRRFTNELSLDAFHPHAQNRVDVEALVNEIPTNLKSAQNLLKVDEKATVLRGSYRWLLLNSHLALEPWEGK